MATHSSILAWRIPWTQKPGGLQSTGPRRVGHDWRDLARTAGTLRAAVKAGPQASPGSQGILSALHIDG